MFAKYLLSRHSTYLYLKFDIFSPDFCPPPPPHTHSDRCRQSEHCSFKSRLSTFSQFCCLPVRPFVCSVCLSLGFIKVLKKAFQFSVLILVIPSHLFIYLCMYVMYLCIYVCTCLHIYQSFIKLSISIIDLFIFYQSIYISYIYIFIYISNYLFSVYLSVSIYLSMSIYLSIYPGLKHV